MYCLHTRNVELVTSNVVVYWIVAQCCCHQSVRRENLVNEFRICKCCALGSILCSEGHHSEILGLQAGLGVLGAVFCCETQGWGLLS